MLRTGASRLALRSIAGPAARPAAPSFTPPLQWTSRLSSMASRRPQLPPMRQLTPIQGAVLRRAMVGKIDRKAEDRYQHEKLEPHPELVTTTSSVRSAFSEVATPEAPKDVDMMARVKYDFTTIKDTFDLSAVPRQAYLIGLAGVLPYLATSISTVYCAWEINHSVAGYGYFLSAQTAEQLLHFLEPLQVGYGAVILSFLGAIHWGLEFAGYGGNHGYKRYAIGVVAPAVAWPTILMPVEYALITQFMAFTVLYYVDTRAATRGWTPSWYGIYRFVLTFIVGASIVLSLVGRGEVADHIKGIPGAVDRMKNLKDDAQQALSHQEEGIGAQKAADAAKED
ncbi:hypothetical protein P154DRAFT_439485 [Amniculicola lignicola CBS 123094]|uniref:Uncharacterized protein n=1 Tax=Amniculicola lignicola CBS 123094 TaxID=1392246 RepID=A0A6A5W8K0_9PLEO|nr:hypothetical protein P154DRAFT_439485 [Amniculicola lignicola CBS 123094]